MVLTTAPSSRWLIKEAARYPETERSDLRIAGGLITERGRLSPAPDERVVDGQGACLLPGLIDHHIHLRALAAARHSIDCGPPAVNSYGELSYILSKAKGDGWIRGIGYHDSVAGTLTRDVLDSIEPNRPIRIQHRSGRLWTFNSLAISQLSGLPAPVGTDSDHYSELEITAEGRLFDQDRALGERLRMLADATVDSQAVSEVSKELSKLGVTGLHDMTPSNGIQEFDWFGQLQANGQLRQKLCLSGTIDLHKHAPTHWLETGGVKFHLHEHALPDLQASTEHVRRAHTLNLPVAIHCVTRTELVFALSMLEAAGIHPGDRIEHGSVIEADLESWLVDLDPGIVTQPHFILDRGDQYLTDVPSETHSSLYRFQTLKALGLRVALGSDAPFGDVDPWRSMRAAVTRQTRSGQFINTEECVSPETALEGYLGHFSSPFTVRRLDVGEPADLVLLTRPWSEVRDRLNSEDVRMTWCHGEATFDREILSDAE